jgi:phosphate/sulfate permease
MILTLLFIAACFLAYNNGANDNFKGVATLFGSHTTNYKKAIIWVWTVNYLFFKILLKKWFGAGPEELHSYYQQKINS